MGIQVQDLHRKEKNEKIKKRDKLMLRFTIDTLKYLFAQFGEKYFHLS